MTDEAVAIVAPQLGEGLREVTIVSLLRRSGQAIARDEPLVLVESDKSTVEIEAPVSGIVGPWCVREGDVVAIGAVLTHLLPAAATPTE